MFLLQCNSIIFFLFIIFLSNFRNHDIDEFHNAKVSITLWNKNQSILEIWRLCKIYFFNTVKYQQNHPVWFGLHIVKSKKQRFFSFWTTMAFDYSKPNHDIPIFCQWTSWAVWGLNKILSRETWESLLEDCVCDDSNCCSHMLPAWEWHQHTKSGTKRMTKKMNQSPDFKL